MAKYFIKFDSLDKEPVHDDELKELAKGIVEPKGFYDISLQRYIGTNIYQWYVCSQSPYWKPYGELIVLRGRR